MKRIELEQGTDAWLRWRNLGVGASDAPIIMGVSPFKTVLQLYREKMGLEVPPPPHPGMLRGIRLEPVARAWYEDKMGIAVTPCCVEHDTITFMRASLDGLSIFGDLLVEIKCPSQSDHALAVQGTVPYPYWVQMQHQFYVTGLSEGHYVSFDGTDGVVLPVRVDPDFQILMVEREQAFMDCIELGEEPVTDAWTNAASVYIQAMQERDAADARMKMLQRELAAMLPDGAKTHEGGGVKVTLVEASETMDWLKVAEAALGHAISLQNVAQMVVAMSGKTIEASHLEAGRIARKGFVKVTAQKGFEPPVAVSPVVNRVDDPLLMQAANAAVMDSGMGVVVNLDW